jgi:predicted dehydrogenase
MLRIGIIGSGFGLYGLLPAFAAVPNCQVVALCGRKTDRVATTTAEYGVQNVYEDWQKMLEAEQLDAIVTAVKPETQYEILKVAIPKGLNVYAEKPLAVTLNQAQELLELAKKYHITHGVDFIFPEIGAWQELKKLLDDQRLGKIKKVHMAWNFLSHDFQNKLKTWKTDPIQGGGALAYYFSHCLYYLEYLFGPISEVSAQFLYSQQSMSDGETGLDLHLTFTNGAQGEAHLNSAGTGLQHHTLRVIGKKGSVQLENQDSVVDGFQLQLFDELGKPQLSVIKDQDLTKTEDQRSKIVHKIATRFVTACLNHQSMEPNFTAGVRVQELIEQIRKTANSPATKS